jgi:hypothetical protein
LICLNLLGIRLLLCRIFGCGALLSLSIGKLEARFGLLLEILPFFAALELTWNGFGMNVVLVFGCIPLVLAPFIILDILD